MARLLLKVGNDTDNEYVSIQTENIVCIITNTNKITKLTVGKPTTQLQSSVIVEVEGLSALEFGSTLSVKELHAKIVEAERQEYTSDDINDTNNDTTTIVTCFHKKTRTIRCNKRFATSCEECFEVLETNLEEGERIHTAPKDIAIGKFKITICTDCNKIISLPPSGLEDCKHRGKAIKYEFPNGDTYYFCPDCNHIVHEIINNVNMILEVLKKSEVIQR